VTAGSGPDPAGAEAARRVDDEPTAGPAPAAGPVPPPEPSPEAARQVLATPLERIPGVGSFRAEKLARLDLVTARDALLHFPREYRDFSGAHAVAALRAGAWTVTAIQDYFPHLARPKAEPKRTLAGAGV
jgi:hypothetical protein